jgi:hypothetical protein
MSWSDRHKTWSLTTEVGVSVGTIESLGLLKHVGRWSPEKSILQLAALVSFHLFPSFLSAFDISTEAVKCFSLHKDTTPPQPSHTVTPTHIEPEQYNPWDKSTISRKLLKMDVLTSETRWAVNSEIIEQVTSSWSIFIQLSRWCTVQ